MNGIDYHISPLSLKNDSDDSRIENEMYKDCFEHYLNKDIIFTKWHHNGPCVPAVRRLFVNAEGQLYPCEKIDSDPACILGTLETGINIGKAVEILNVGRLTQQECKKCWAIRFCTMCVRNCIDNGSCSKSRKLEYCSIQKKNALAFLKKYSKCRTTEREIL